MNRYVFATRPWSFIVSATPVIAAGMFIWMKVGASEINWINLILCLVGIILFHAAGNVHSDYYDFKTGIDNKDAFCIPNLVSGDYKPSEYKVLSIILLVAGCIVGLLIAWMSVWQVIAIGVAGAILTLLYPCTKFVALGDLDIFVIFGLLAVSGTSYAILGYFVPEVLLVAVPVGCITTAVLHVNNTRDMNTDSAAGATSFAKILGVNASVWYYRFLLFFPLIFNACCVATGLFPLWSLLTLLAIPALLPATKTMAKIKTEGLSAINTLDQKTAQLHMVSSLLLIVSFIIAAIF